KKREKGEREREGERGKRRRDRGGRIEILFELS
ncbi:hypothetical protein CSUI_002126, partial [Cystoisospora suis]